MEVVVFGPKKQGELERVSVDDLVLVRTSVIDPLMREKVDLETFVRSNIYLVQHVI